MARRNVRLLSHRDRDGGSKCVTTGSICVPCKKSLKVQEKSFQAFLCLYKNAVELEREQKFANLSHQGHYNFYNW